MRHDSTGRRLLMRVLQLHSHTAVARICRVSQPAVTKWKIGITRPSEERRAILETRYKIPHWSWNQQPSQPQGRHIGVVPEQE